MVVAILAAIIGVIIRSVNRTYGAFEDFYAIDQTRMMLTDYTIANEGTWPSSWDDLRQYYDRYKNLGWSENFESHQRLVDVDFAFVPKTFFASRPQPHSTPLKLVSVKSFRNDIDWEELNKVNRRLLATLRSIHDTE